MNDVIAVTAFIGSIFGAGGGGEAANADLLAEAAAVSSARKQGHDAWEDVMLADDPEAPTTIDERFEYGPLTGGKVKGSVILDAGLDREHRPAPPRPPRPPPPRRGRQASNWLLTAPQRSATGNSLAVMGPQLGYYYPEIVQQIDLHGPGINAQGVAVPGLAMYIADRPDPGLRLEPDLGRPRRPRRLRRASSASPTARSRRASSDALPLQGQVPSVRGASTRACWTATRSPTTLSVHGPRVRDRDRRRQAVRAVAPALDLRPRRAEPRRAQGHDRAARRRPPKRFWKTAEQVRLHLQLGVRLAQADRVLQLRPAARARPRARPPPADARDRQVRVEGLPGPARSIPTTSAARAACC